MNLDALQTAIYSKLVNDAAVMETAVDVFADKPQPAVPEDVSGFPNITFGQDTGSPWDTKTDFGATVLSQIDIWSRSNNYIEIKQLGGAIHDALHHRPLIIENADHTMTVAVSATYTDDPDGHTKRGLLVFRITYDNI